VRRWQLPPAHEMHGKTTGGCEIRTLTLPSSPFASE